MAKQKTVFCCTECGNETANWSGRCPKCGSWNTLKEVTFDNRPKGKESNQRHEREMKTPKRITELDISSEIRFSTGISEFDRVLGGGAVIGSLVLVGGSPGIGKSTILLQMCGKIASDKNILYVSGEESERQLKLRASRLGVNSSSIFVLSETDISSIVKTVSETQPEVLIIDSIQTVSDYDNDSAPGSVSQVRECTMRIMRVAKEQGLTVFIVGHVNKEGTLAGPKILEHMVDCVLYFEGDQNSSFRLLRAAKNRFGSTNEIGVFEMNDVGLSSVENPSEMLLAGRPDDTPGTCVTCIMEGSRPILAEIQALITPGAYNASRRCNGIDYNRAAMLLAVTEKRGGLSISGCDSYINVIGGLTLDEPAADLATVLAIASSYLDRPLGSEVAALGEVGLSGEIRSVSSLNQRLSEIARLGFQKCVIPAHIRGEISRIQGLETIPVRNIYDAIRTVLKKA